MTQTCATCKFMISGGCRRYPPYAHSIIVPREPKAGLQLPGAPALVPVEESRAMFPTVRPDWWCGEFSPRVELAS